MQFLTALIAGLFALFPQNVSTTSAPVVGAAPSVLKVQQGGTGASTFAIGECLKGNGTGPITTGTCGTSSGGSGLASTTPWTNGYLTAVNSNAAIYGVPTTTLTASSPLSLSNPVVKVGGSNSVLTIDTSGAWTGNAGTATALAANGANCSAGSFPLGVDASGAVESCADAWTEAENTSAAYLSSVNLATNVTGDLPFSNLAQVAANSVLGNITSGTADAASIATTSLYAGTQGQILARTGAGWTGTATTTFSTGLTYASGNVTLDTASASVFGGLTSAFFSKFNSATTTFSNGLAYSAGVASLAAIGGNSILANITSGSAIPVALATSSFFSLTSATTIPYASSTSFSAINASSTFAWFGTLQVFASTSLQNFTFLNATGTAATTTSFSAIDASSTRAAIGTLTLSNKLTVANGGSGAGTLTGLLQGNGTSAFTAISDSSTGGQILRVTGASTYAWGALDLADTDAITNDLPFANLTQGAANTILANRTGATADFAALATSSFFCLTCATTITYASSTASSATNFQSTNATSTTLYVSLQSILAATGGRVGIGTTTPWANLSVNPIAGDSMAFVVGSSTSLSNLFGINTNGSITLMATTVAPTSTAMQVDWSKTGPLVEIKTGTSAFSINIINATTSLYAGSSKKIMVCNPSGTAGALTWTGVEWTGGTTPTQTTTTNVCDLYSFFVSSATSSLAAPTWKVFGAQTANFP